MLSIHFAAPQLEEEFKGWDFILKVTQSLKTNCVIRSSKDSDNRIVIEVAHIFRLLQIPVQEFLIYQTLFMHKLSLEGEELLKCADEQAFYRLVEKYGDKLDATFVYAATIFITEFQYKKNRLEFLNLLYADLMLVKSEAENFQLKYQNQRGG